MLLSTSRKSQRISIDMFEKITKTFQQTRAPSYWKKF